MSKILTVAVLVAVVVGGGAWWGGMKYAQRSAADVAGALSTRGRVSDGTQFRRGNFGTGTFGTGSFAIGEVVAKDAQSVTLKLRDGGSKIVLYSAATEVSKFVSGTATDLVVGKAVSVGGKANADGSITAQSIQIRPNLPSPSPSPSKWPSKF